MLINKKYSNFFKILFLTLFILIGISLFCSAYSKDNTNINTAVKLGEEIILHINNPAEGLNEQQRAEKISKQLEQIFKTSAIDSDEIYIEKKGENRVIFLKKLLINLTPKDIESLNLNQENSQIKIINKLTNAANKYYKKQSIKSTILSLLIILSLFFLIVIPFYHSIFIRWYNYFEEWLASNIEKAKNIICPPFQLLLKYLLCQLDLFCESNSSTCNLNNNKCAYVLNSTSIFESKYKTESLDNKGRLIKHIYFYKKDFIIYKTIDSVEWMINHEYPSISPLDYSNRINKIMFSLANLESQNPKKIGRPETINKLVAQGIKLALEDSIEDSQKLLDKAKERLKTLRITYFKQHYLIASFYTSSLIIFTMACINYMYNLFGEYVLNILEIVHISTELTTVIICGCLGGFLSVAYGIKKIIINPDDDFVVVGVSRIFIAVISSIIIYVTVKADIVSDLSQLFLNDSSKVDLWKVGFISVIAGFIESLVPNLLKKQASKEDQQNDHITT